MTVREFLAGLQHLPIDAEVLAFEAGCEEYCEREIDEVEDLLDRPGHVPGVAQVAFACRAADVSAGAALLRAGCQPRPRQELQSALFLPWQSRQGIEP